MFLNILICGKLIIAVKWINLKISDVKFLIMSKVHNFKIHISFVCGSERSNTSGLQHLHERWPLVNPKPDVSMALSPQGHESERESQRGDSEAGLANAPAGGLITLSTLLLSELLFQQHYSLTSPCLPGNYTAELVLPERERRCGAVSAQRSQRCGADQMRRREKDKYINCWTKAQTRHSLCVSWGVFTFVPLLRRRSKKRVMFITLLYTDDVQ